LFWFIGFLDHIGIAVTISLSIVILSYTLIFFNVASKTSGFIYISYLLLVFFIYFQDFWLNQLRLTVSLVLFFYIFTRLAYIKDFWKSKIVIVFPIFFHIQIFAAVVPSVISSKYFGIILVGSAYPLKELLTVHIMVMLTNNIDLSTASKIFEYYNMSSLTNSNSIQLIRIALMAALSLVLYFVYKRGSLALMNISCANLFFGVIFYDYPSIFGRITSLLIFFEPLLISSLGKSLFKYLYMLLLMANIIFKNFAT
jgi:hypothetical protein